jgi:hypothetical protein
MAQDVLITPASGLVDFLETSASKAQVQLDASNNLNITCSGGNLVVGDAASDVYIGNGIATTNIIFSNSGAIKGTGTQTISLGTSGDTIKIADGATADLGFATYTLHAQFALSGGGDIIWNGSRLKWTTRVIAIPVGKNSGFSSSGYFDITIPLSGTITYYNSSNVTTTLTCDGNGIPIGTWEGLWYKLPVGGGSTSVQANFAVANYQNSTWRIDPGWVLLATRNGDGASQSIRWLPGQVNFPSSGSNTWYSDLGYGTWATGPQGVQGVSGPTGPQGVQGVSGPTGPQGVQGISGPTGPQGFQGFQGIQGVSGPTGPQGVQGVSGPTGPQGVQGVSGPTGPQGFQGFQGIQGIQGVSGPTGPQGVQGISGPTGPQGFQGFQGIQGVSGPTGPQGIQGVSGPSGPQGVQGVSGPTGPQGFQGFQGIQGATGSSVTGPPGPPGPPGGTGPSGPQGVQGATGSSITGPPGPPGGTGPEGVQGATGSSITGPPGPPGGTGVQGATGSSITGPPGPPGGTGPEGVQGATGSSITGPPGPPGPPGGNGVQGVQGIQGAQGVQGAAGAQSSDYRVKENLKKFDDGYGIVKQVQSYKYNFTTDHKKTEVSGMIAHELQEAGQVIGVSGKKDDFDGPQGLPIYQSVNYVNLIPTLWSAVRECISRIEYLEAKVKVLENAN